MCPIIFATTIRKRKGIADRLVAKLQQRNFAVSRGRERAPAENAASCAGTPVRGIERASFEKRMAAAQQLSRGSVHGSRCPFGGPTTERAGWASRRKRPH